MRALKRFWRMVKKELRSPFRVKTEWLAKILVIFVLAGLQMIEAYLAHS